MPKEREVRFPGLQLAPISARNTEEIQGGIRCSITLVSFRQVAASSLPIAVTQAGKISGQQSPRTMPDNSIAERVPGRHRELAGFERTVTVKPTQGPNGDSYSVRLPIFMSP